MVYNVCRPIELDAFITSSDQEYNQAALCSLLYDKSLKRWGFQETYNPRKKRQNVQLDIT